VSEFLTVSGLTVAADLVVRATILLSVAMFLQRWFRTWPPAIRHHLWTLTFVLLVALPVFRVFGPSWTVPLGSNAHRLSVASTPPEVAGSLIAADSGAGPASFSSLAIGASPGPGTSDAPPARPWVRWVLAFWAAGCGAALVSLGIGVRRFSGLVRAGQTFEEEAWLSQLDALRRRLSIRAKVRLVLATESVTPMTGGVLQPVILLPVAATDWSAARRRAVLAHELVHVRRRDALRQLLFGIVLSLYWFHPLSWVAWHFAAVRREEACDEEVLAAGARPSEYAGHLLALAESGSFRRSALSLPLASQSQLERRIRAILDPGRPRPRALAAAAVLVAAAVGGVSVSIANPTRPDDAPAVAAEAAGVESPALHCIPASEADELSGWEFAPGLGEALVCTIQGETVTTATDGTRVIGPADWGVLEGEIRKQLEERRPGLP